MEETPILKMCSRAGKSTINQYLAFSKESNKHKSFSRNDSNEFGDKLNVQNLMGGPDGFINSLNANGNGKELQF